MTQLHLNVRVWTFPRKPELFFLVFLFLFLFGKLYSYMNLTFVLTHP